MENMLNKKSCVGLSSHTANRQCERAETTSLSSPEELTLARGAHWTTTKFPPCEMARGLQRFPPARWPGIAPSHDSPGHYGIIASYLLGFGMCSKNFVQS